MPYQMWGENMIDDKETSVFTKWYANGANARDLTNKQFYEVLDCIDFELKSQVLDNNTQVFYLTDLQYANLANIEQDIFCIAEDFSIKTTHKEKFMQIKRKSNK